MLSMFSPAEEHSKLRTSSGNGRGAGIAPRAHVNDAFSVTREAVRRGHSYATYTSNAQLP